MPDSHLFSKSYFNKFEVACYCFSLQSFDV